MIELNLNEISFREAAIEDAKALSALAIRSKAYWGYSPEFMDACIEELTVTSSNIQDDEYFIEAAWLRGEILGFYTLEPHDPGEIELGAMFLQPDYIGKGIGKMLMDRAKQKATDLGARKMHIQGDPNAQRFYETAGAMQVGFKPSESIPGRLLPLFELELD